MNREMISVFHEIEYLRGNEDYEIDRRNKNRYRVVVKESEGSTSYCFSMPIYEAKSGRLIAPDCERSKERHLERTNCTVSIGEERYVLQNQSDRAEIVLQKTPNKENIRATPTANGVLLGIKSPQSKITVSFKNRSYEIHMGANAVSFMREAFIPFLCVSPLFAVKTNGERSPLPIGCIMTEDKEYELNLSGGEDAQELWVEISMYEPKLFQDTTVQSAKPNQNNAYGVVSFLGESQEFGQQWLYSRPDFSRIDELYSERIERVLLHIPVFHGAGAKVQMFVPEARFCSFGSTWNKKISHSAESFSAECGERYLTLDVTKLFTDHAGRGLMYNEGIILKYNSDQNDCILLATGDCVSAPQILEVRCK